VFVRSVRPTLHNPVVIVIGLAQPMLYLLLFGPLLRGVAGSGSSWQWFVPGVMVQMALFGTAYAGFGLIPEIRPGALERLRVTPVRRTALLLGGVLRDVVLLVVQCGLIAPRWLRMLAAVNPLSHVVDAERAIMAGQSLHQAVWLGPLLAIALAVAGACWGVATFRRQQA
jgi:ABC-type multidrug transport system permease subunit